MNSRKAQASLEYFIIFAVIAGLTLLSVSTFLNRTRTSSQNLYSKAVGRILNSQALTPSPTPTPTPTPSPTPPPDAIPLPWFAQNRPFFPAGSQTVYTLPLTDQATSLRMEIVGLTNETNLTFTWIFPDGHTFTGRVNGDSIAGIMNLRTSLAQYPNLPNYDYIPLGVHQLIINSTRDSRVIIRAYYE